MPLSRLGVLIAIPVSAVCTLYLGLYESHIHPLIPVPVRDLPAYHQIQPTDLVQRKVSAKTLTLATLKESKRIVNLYTLTPVLKDKPLSKDKLSPQVDTARLSDTVAIGIPATPAMVLGGNLEAGDIVDVIVPPAATKLEPQLPPLVLRNILVLDVKSMQENKFSANQLSDAPFVVVVALPVARLQEFATKSVGAKLLISRKLDTLPSPSPP